MDIPQCMPVIVTHTMNALAGETHEIIVTWDVIKTQAEED